MTISKDEAAQALGEVEDARGRVVRITAYAYAAPFMVLWGLAWLIADTVTQLDMAAAPWVWLAVSISFSLITAVVVVLQSRRLAGAERRKRWWRSLAISLIIMLFLASVFALLAPVSGKQVHAVIGLAFGVAYVIMGLWLGGRLIVLGAVLAALSLFGFFALDHWYPLFMGVVGGGALVLGGLWLRRI